jgi:hypothetical protein
MTIFDEKGPCDPVRHQPSEHRIISILISNQGPVIWGAVPGAEIIVKPGEYITRAAWIIADFDAPARFGECWIERGEDVFSVKFGATDPKAIHAYMLVKDGKATMLGNPALFPSLLSMHDEWIAEHIRERAREVTRMLHGDSG